MDKNIVELPDKQEIAREMVVLPKMPVRTACQQEEFIEEEICNSSLPELCKAQKGMHEDDIQLEVTKVNTTEISELPREIKLEMPIEQRKSNLHTKWKKVLGSKVVRRANPTKLVKREVCRPPPKPPDRQNSVNYEHETKKEENKAIRKSSGKTRNKKWRGRRDRCPKIDKELNCRLPPKPL